MENKTLSKLSETTTQAEKTSDRYYYGIGRRKRSIARVRLYRGEGKFTINKKDIDVYLRKTNLLKNIILEPFKNVGQENKFNVSVIVSGGGFKGQTEAIRLGISRALVLKNQTYKVPLKKAGFLTRDPREIERKKPGLKKARRAPQWAKR